LLEWLPLRALMLPRGLVLWLPALVQLQFGRRPVQQVVVRWLLRAVGLLAYEQLVLPHVRLWSRAVFHVVRLSRRFRARARDWVVFVEQVSQPVGRVAARSRLALQPRPDGPPHVPYQMHHQHAQKYTQSIKRLKSEISFSLPGAIKAKLEQAGQGENMN